jgi:hypothetical protein
LDFYNCRYTKFTCGHTFNTFYRQMGCGAVMIMGDVLRRNEVGTNICSMPKPGYKQTPEHAAKSRVAPVGHKATPAQRAALDKGRTDRHKACAQARYDQMSVGAPATKYSPVLKDHATWSYEHVYTPMPEGTNPLLLSEPAPEPRLVVHVPAAEVAELGEVSWRALAERFGQA